MPGVPSSRACDACRKQRKKCDETKPSCSRCSRLQIPCIGSGQQRYKFKEQNGPMVKPTKDGQDGIGLVATSKTRPSIAHLFSPSNDHTMLAHEFVGAIKLSVDLRYNLSWAFGGFFDLIPKRLGYNEALDASVAALVSAHSDFCAYQGHIMPYAFAKYSQALSTLRLYLNDPVKARAADTLCAVMVLLMCQTMIGSNGNAWTGHCEGATEILKARGFYNPNDLYERVLVLTLRGPVLVEGIFNPKIRLTTQEWQTLIQTDLDQSTLEGRIMRCIGHVPLIVQRARHTCKGEREHFKLTNEARELYQTMSALVTELRSLLDTAAEALPDGLGAQATRVVQIHAHYQRLYGLALTFVIILNCLLAALMVKDTSLAEDLERYSKDVVVLAEGAARYRPLGASWVVLCLCTAWTTTKVPETRTMLDSALTDYAGDFPKAQLRPALKGKECSFLDMRLLGQDTETPS